jgi:hypothetical protein
MLNEINTLRKDAHSNYLSENDFVQLRIYFNKLDAFLKDWT